MATHGEEGAHERTHAYLTELDACIRRVLEHHNAGQVVVPPRDDVPDIRNVNGESFFHRNLWIPENIWAHQSDVGVSGAGRSTRLQGEVLVTFYHYTWDSGMFEHKAIPLQYLYKNYGQVMASEWFPRQGATDEPDGRPLQIMEFPTCYYAKDFLKAFSSEHIWNLRDRGDSLRPGVSFQLPLGSQHFTVAISIPYLGVEKNIGLPARSTHEAYAPVGASGGQDRVSLERLKRLEELTDFRKCPRPSWPQESLTLNQNRCPGASYDDPEGGSVGEPSILVHRAGIILLNTSSVDYGGDRERLAIFRSRDDKNSGRVPLLPHQKSKNALDAFLNVLSNTLKSYEKTVLENLRCKASNYSLDFQKFARGSNVPEGFESVLISTSATLSGELSAVTDVAKSQKRYIKDLQEFLTSLNTSSDNPNGSLRPSGEWGEKRRTLLRKINFLLQERQMFLDEVNEIFSGVKAVEKSFYQLSTLKTSQSISSAIRRHRKETVVEMQRQGRKFRKAWWKRIIPSQEKAPPPSSSDADP